MALEQWRPDDVVHYLDHGCQYTSLSFGRRCEAAGVRPSIGSVGDAYDNAMAEAFFASLELELLDRRAFRSHAEARLAVFRYIELWYSPRRRYSALGYLSPMTLEGNHRAAGTAGALAAAERRGHSHLPATAALYPAALQRKLSTPSAERRLEPTVPQFSPVY